MTWNDLRQKPVTRTFASICRRMLQAKVKHSKAKALGVKDKTTLGFMAKVKNFVLKAKTYRHWLER